MHNNIIDSKICRTRIKDSRVRTSHNKIRTGANYHRTSIGIKLQNHQYKYLTTGVQDQVLNIRQPKNSTNFLARTGPNPKSRNPRIKLKS